MCVIKRWRAVNHGLGLSRKWWRTFATDALPFCAVWWWQTSAAIAIVPSLLKLKSGSMWGQGTVQTYGVANLVRVVNLGLGQWRKWWRTLPAFATDVLPFCDARWWRTSAAFATDPSPLQPKSGSMWGQGTAQTYGVANLVRDMHLCLGLWRKWW